MYKDLKGILPELVQHEIEFDTTIPLAHQTKYMLNPNYITTMKYDINKLLVTCFIQLLGEATWLSLIVIIL